MIKEEVLRSFAGRTVVVIGGTGLIGRQVVDILSDAGTPILRLFFSRVNRYREVVYE